MLQPIFSLLLTTSAFAELPPKVYHDLQQKADDQLEIKVLSKTSSRLGFYNFSSARKQTVKVKILNVIRTKNGLKVGNTITLTYTHKPLPKNAVGPSPIPLLRIGKEYPAWIQKSPNGMFAPAARGFSFRKIE